MKYYLKIRIQLLLNILIYKQRKKEGKVGRRETGNKLKKKEGRKKEERKETHAGLSIAQLSTPSFSITKM